ncbi:MAG TPA: hypothetical protein VFH97_02920 [Gemmatimonadales bacterium]|nr:hypothetical protein [Gemmatimonadales bacterium]
MVSIRRRDQAPEPVRNGSLLLSLTVGAVLVVGATLALILL